MRHQPKSQRSWLFLFTETFNLLGERTGMLEAGPLHGVDGGQEHRAHGRRIRQELAQHQGP